MEPLLFLCHRIPYPLNKGEKIRAWNILKHLARRYSVYMATFVDDPEDWVHRNVVGELCADFHVERLDRRAAKLRSLTAALSGAPLTLPYFWSESVAEWVEGVIRGRGIQRAFVYSSAMAGYVLGHNGLRVVVDLVDVDSDKWNQYARASRWPMSWVYAREARTLLRYERRIAKESQASLLVSDVEVALFRRLAPESSDKVFAVPTGVDSDYYTTRPEWGNPFPHGTAPIVFTGVMDYRPNVDAVVWFASKVLPTIAARYADARFYIVGMNPAPEVAALAKDPRVVVTGRVPDTRPHLQHARVVVAPLRLARGVQTKVLEAMAMARPVVASRACAGPLSVRPGCDIEVADTPESFAEAVLALLDDHQRAESIGSAARAQVLEVYGWSRSLDTICNLLDGGIDRSASAESPGLRVQAAPNVRLREAR